MDERLGTESSWIPKTPMKLTRAEQQSICKEKQTNSPSNPHGLIADRNSETSQPCTGNCSHLGNSICFQKEIHAQNVDDSCNLKDSVQERFDNHGVAMAGNPSGINKDSRFYLDLWNRGMEHLRNDDAAAAAAAAQTAVHVDKSSFISASIYHVKCASSREESSYSSSTFQGLFQESGCQSAFETCNYETNGAELNGGILSHTAPSTPNLTNTADKAQGSGEQNYRVGVAAKENEDHALNKIPIELSELQKEGQPEQIVDISCSNGSKTMVENHEPDMGSSQNIDVKTPQQRPRKKKHRPKVVIEGKPRRRPRNTTPASSEKVNTPKRKYVRRNNISTEAETPTEGKIQGDLGSEAKTTPKRKYTRRKEVNEPTMTPPEEGVSGTSSPKDDQTSQRSCRRSLNFEFDSQISDLGCKSTSQISLTENQMTSTLKREERVDINVQRTETCFAQYSQQSMGKEFEEYLLSKGVKTVGSSPPTEFDQLNNKSMSGSINEYSSGRCQIVFSNATHDKVTTFSESRTQKERGATKPLYTPNYSSILTQETYGRGRKREQPSSAGLFDSYGIYSAVPQVNYFHDFTEVSQSKELRQEFSFQHFPETFKKKRTKQMRNFTNSTMMPAVASTGHRIQNYATSIVNNCRESNGFGMMQVNISADSGPSRISKVHSAQLKQTPSEWIHPLRNADQITMKESNGLPHSYLLSCFTPARMLKRMPSVDDIVEQFNRLSVSTESNTLASVEKNALFAYPCEYSGKNALVVYQSDQTMIPFGASSIRRKHGPRPKVNLDEETARVWTLLLENIDSEGIDGTDEEKRKYWQKERKIFRGRVNSFIAKMRLVQGDRRFRPWKGSVVDSVVGVFLTQNVSDHLSSSAFMSMAARFPLKPSSDRASSSEGISEIQDLLHLDEDTLGEAFGDFQAMKNDENYLELVRNYQKLVRNCTEVTESTGTLKSPSSDSSECGPSASNGETVMSDGDVRASGDILCSQTSVVSPQNSTDSVVQTDNKKELCSHMFLEEESTSVCFQNTSFVELLQMQEQRVHNPGNRSGSPLGETRTNSEMTEIHLEREADHRDFAESLSIKLSGSSKESECIATDQSGLSEESGAGPSSQNSTGICFERHMMSMENHESAVYSRLAGDQQTEFISTGQKHASSFSESTLDATNLERKPVKLDASKCKNSLETTSGVSTVKPKPKGGKISKESEPEVDWDSYRKQAEAKGKRERSSNTMDSVDWETVRCTEVGEIAETIKERGMNNRLAERIKDFLNRLIRDHGSLDLEWLRDIPPDKAKEYLLSVKGLGLKSVECVRLLTLHHLAFPVDTNVGRIAVRLGWVPLEPLPESLQLHLLELYPVLESIQKHLWPRLCKLDQRKLYELHYHMITFGKVFCTKSKPNCNSCPMRGECRHFASAYASARLALPAPQDKSIVTAPAPAPAPSQRTAHANYAEKVDLLQLPRPESTENFGAASLLPFSEPTFQVSESPKPIIEEPTTPESDPVIEEPQMSESEADTETETMTEPQWTQCPVDIEDYIDNDDEIPTIDLNLEALNQNLQSIMQNVGLQDSEYSKALMVLTPEAASIPMPKLKNINRLRTEHRVYLLPDSHQLLKGLERREENDPCPYLLAIWAPGETINSIQPPERKCSNEGSGQLCFDNTCYSCNSIREATSHTVRGTILIPCRTAMRGSFPLNGTYFQVNEVFADHETSLKPIDVPRDWLWNLRRRTVYFGTSIPTIFKGLEPYEIQYCFWKGFVCVRGFDRATRGPRPLIARLHFPVSRMPKINKEGAAGSGLAKDASDETRAAA